MRDLLSSIHLEDIMKRCGAEAAASFIIRSVNKRTRVNDPRVVKGEQFKAKQIIVGVAAIAVLAITSGIHYNVKIWAMQNVDAAYRECLPYSNRVILCYLRVGGLHGG